MFIGDGRKVLIQLKKILRLKINVMRDIKFRAWMKSKNKMIENAQNHISFCEMLCIKEDFIVMQYTGLKDKNGKEIYEGDIVLAHGNTANFPLKYVIVFNDKCAFKMRWEGRQDESSFYDEDISENGYKIFKVIGNIYENPELLTVR